MITHLLVSARHVITAVILLVVAFPVFGQSSELFTVTSKASDIAVAKQSSYLKKVTNNPHTKSAYLIKVGKPSKLQKNGIIKFSLPGYPKQVTASTLKIEASSEQDYNWSANVSVDGDSSIIGSMVLISEKGNAFGQINVGEQAYEIRSDADGTTTLSEIDISTFGGKHCENTGESKEIVITNPSPLDLIQTKTTPSSGRQETCREQMVVLALVTPAARAANANINQTIITAINQHNSAIYDSQIGSSAAVSVIIRAFNFVESTPGPLQPNVPIITDLNRISNDPNASQLRDNPQIQADIVALITNGNYGVNSNALGRAARVDPIRNPVVPC